MRPNEPVGQDGVAAAIQAIRDDREHGASWLARAAARVFALADEQLRNATPAEWDAVMRATAQSLVSARPSMAAVANVAARIWSVGQTRASSIAREALLAEAARLAEPDERAQRAMVELAAQRLHGTVYTLSRSGTLEHVLRELGQGHIIEGAIVAESRPGAEGIALGRALAHDGLPVLIVADAASGVFIGQAACVALGADSLRANGSLVNKVGSYPLALVAHQAGIPIYVVCETLKIAAPDFPLELEEKDPAELVPDVTNHLAARNPYFDTTPAPLITSYITEEGILGRDAIALRAQGAGEALRRLRAG